MPESGDCAAFKNTRRQNFNPDQDHRDQHDHEGHYRVHRDAQHAVVGIAIGCMDMHYLGHSQKCEQDQAHEGCHSQSSLL